MATTDIRHRDTMLERGVLGAEAELREVEGRHNTGLPRLMAGAEIGEERGVCRYPIGTYHMSKEREQPQCSLDPVSDCKYSTVDI